jgi:hypothetical protein
LVTLIHLASPLCSSITYFMPWCREAGTLPLSYARSLFYVFQQNHQFWANFRTLLIAKVILGHSRELRNLVYTANPVQSTRQDGA